MKTIVVITPTRIEADSRTFKQAVSLERFGYRSIVIEGQPSEFSRADLPFALQTIPQLGSGREPTGGSEADSAARPRAQKKTGGLFHGMRRRLKSSPLGPPLQFAYQFANFLARYFYQYGWVPLKHMPQASLYYLHAPNFFPTVYLLSRWHRVPFIYDAHDFYSGMKDRREMTSTLEWWSNRFFRLVEYLCVRKAAAVTTVSDGIAAWQHEAFGSSPVVLRNVHDSRLDQTSGLSLREVLGLAPKTFLLVTVGQAKPGQAVDEALTALATLPEAIHLAFVGKYYEPYLDQIRALGLEWRVHLVAPVKPYEVVPFIRSADASLILYYPRTRNYQHCLPNGFFQSIAAELPLLYPELPEIKKLAEQYELGVPINPQEPSSIRRAVLELLGNPERIQLFRQNLQRANMELSWEREEVVLRDLLADVLK